MVDRSGPMACPVDGTALVMSERQSIEIDYCPTCRGVWLDRGELDKIIERSAGGAPQTAQPAPPPQAPQGTPWAGGHGHDPRHGHGHGYGHQRYPKRKKSFLEELFD
jgi:hypothetical protein